MTTSPQGTPRVVCFGFAGPVVGNPFAGLVGAFTAVYEVLAQLGQLTKANAQYVVSGVVNDGDAEQALRIAGVSKSYGPVNSRSPSSRCSRTACSIGGACLPN